MRRLAAAMAAATLAVVPLAATSAAEAHPYHLSVATAKRVAKERVYYHFGPVTRTKVDWWMRWNARRIDSFVIGSWDNYDQGFATTSFCMATVAVWRTPRGAIKSRLSDESCVY